MRAINIIAFLCSLTITTCITLQQAPICSVYTPHSILQHKEKYLALPVGSAARYATCTGVAWFHERYIAAINLYGHSLITYHFDIEHNTFTMIQMIRNDDGAKFAEPENLMFSPDGTLLAVCNAQPPSLGIYQVDLTSHLITPSPILSMPASSLVHNTKFTSDGNFLACSTFDNENAVIIYKIIQESELSLKRTYIWKNTMLSHRIKAIAFSSDNRFLFMAHSMPINNQISAQKIVLSAYAFNAHNGSIGTLISTVEKTGPLLYIEDIALLNCDTTIIASSQGTHSLFIIPFNPQTGMISASWSAIENPAAQLYFPHGISVSHDEKYLAVANYGDDKFAIYALKHHN